LSENDCGIQNIFADLRYDIDFLQIKSSLNYGKTNFNSFEIINITVFLSQSIKVL